MTRPASVALSLAVSIHAAHGGGVLKVAASATGPEPLAGPGGKAANCTGFYAKLAMCVDNGTVPSSCVCGGSQDAGSDTCSNNCASVLYFGCMKHVVSCTGMTQDQCTDCDVCDRSVCTIATKTWLMPLIYALVALCCVGCCVGCYLYVRSKKRAMMSHAHVRQQQGTQCGGRARRWCEPSSRARRWCPSWRSESSQGTPEHTSDPGTATDTQESEKQGTPPATPPPRRETPPPPPPRMETPPPHTETLLSRAETPAPPTATPVNTPATPAFEYKSDKVTVSRAMLPCTVVKAEAAQIEVHRDGLKEQVYSEGSGLMVGGDPPSRVFPSPPRHERRTEKRGKKTPEKAAPGMVQVTRAKGHQEPPRAWRPWPSCMSSKPCDRLVPSPPLPPSPVTYDVPVSPYRAERQRFRPSPPRPTVQAP